MKKIISYITIFIALYLQLSIVNLNEVNAEETLNIPNTNLIIPESTWITTENTNITPQDNNTNTQVNIIPENIIQNNQQNQENNVSESYFVVTAYYSPLPNQEHYLRWNYQDEIILNGNWIRWASWKDVFPWMFAWPKSYNFWTKIYLEWIWVWEIADRWWAIVSTSTWETRWYQYDRIDMWMWFWEEWLKRALAWWKRTVKWKILTDSNTAISLNLANFPSPDYVVRNLVNKPYLEKNTNPKLAIFDKYIWPESNEASIIELEKIFAEMWLYNWNIDWKYGSIKDSLINYQIKLWVIDLKNDNWAWYFWPKTRTKAMKDYVAFLETKTKLEEDQKRKELAINQIKENVNAKVEKHIASIWNPKPGDIWENVRTLQRTLKTLWYLSVKDSAIFWDKTRLGLIKYQIDKWIVKNQNDAWAWAFWPKTKEILKNELVAVLEKQVLKERNLLSYKK